ncbi:MAG: sensor histidine kinase, partial [Puniceicoccales bacterium]
PLYGVVGMADLLHEQFRAMPESELQSCIEDLRKSASGAHALLENLLSWALFERGLLRYSAQPIKLIPLIDRCISIYEQNANQKQLTIQRVGAEDVVVEGCRPMLESILRNFVCNAVKYSHEGGFIVVHVEATEKAVTVSVCDEGVGMSEEAVAQLFSLSEHETTRGTAGEKGTGIGLQLCRQLAEAHGSKICVESKPGNGSTFSFSLKRIPYESLTYANS